MELQTDAIRELKEALLNSECRQRRLLCINELKSKWIAFLGHAYNGYFANTLWVTQSTTNAESFNNTLFSEIFPELYRIAGENIELWKKIKCFFKWLDVIAQLDDLAKDSLQSPVCYRVEPSLKLKFDSRQVFIKLPEPELILPVYLHGTFNYLINLILDVIFSAIPSAGNIVVRDFWSTQEDYTLSFLIDLEEPDLKVLDDYFHDKNEHIDIISGHPVLEMSLLDDLLPLLDAKLEKQLKPSFNNPKKEALTELTIKLTLPMSDRQLE